MDIYRSVPVIILPLTVHTMKPKKSKRKSRISQERRHLSMTIAATIKKRSKLTNRAIESALGVGTGDGSLFGKYLLGRRTMDREAAKNLAKKADGPGASGARRKWVSPLAKLKLLTPTSDELAKEARENRLLAEESFEQQRAQERELRKTFKALERARHQLERLKPQGLELREGLRSNGWKESPLGQLGAEVAALHTAYRSLLPRGVRIEGIRPAKK